MAMEDKVNEMQIAQAVLSEKLARMQTDIEAVTVAITQLTVTLSSISITLSEAKGGWRMLMIVGGAGAALGSGIVYLIHLFGGK